MLTELMHEGSQNLILVAHTIFTFRSSFFCFVDVHIILFLIPRVGAIFFSPAEFVAILQAQVVDDGTGDDQFR